MYHTPVLPIPGRDLGPLGRIALALCAAAGLCAVLDLMLIEWIKIGAPGHKGEIFFLELAILVAAALVVGSISLFAPERARLAAPFLFVLLAWHTGFQIPIDSQQRFVISVFDALVPLALFLGVVGHWYGTDTGRVAWFRAHWKLMAMFWALCLWGVVLAIMRDVSAQPMLANLKSLLLYPLIVIILPWCIHSWRQLYWATGLMLALITERALDGLYQAYTHQVLKFQVFIGHALVYRIDGHMAATNQYATYLLSGGLIILALVAASQLRRRYRVGLLIPLALIGLALLLTFSRGAWLGAGIALVLLLFMLRPRQALMTLVVLGVILTIVQVAHPGAGSQFLERASAYDSSIVQREQYEAIGFDVIEHYPFGAGWGAWFERTPGGVQAIPGYPWYHDDYLQLTTEIGIPGLIVTLLILGSILLLGIRTSRSLRDPTKAALIAGLTAAFLGMLVQSATDQFLWHADIAPHIWIVGGLLTSACALAVVETTKQARIAQAIRFAGAPATEALPVPG